MKRGKADVEDYFMGCRGNCADFHSFILFKNYKADERINAIFARPSNGRTGGKAFKDKIKKASGKETFFVPILSCFARTDC